MPIIKSAIKRAKQTIKRRDRNVGIKKDIKDATKAFMTTPTAKTLGAAQSELDTAVKKGLLKKNTVARRMTQLSKIAKDAGVKIETGRKAPIKPTVAVKPATKPAAKKPVVKATTVKKAPAKKPAAKK